MAPAIDDVAVDRADAGRAATRGSTLALYCDAAMLPEHGDTEGGAQLAGGVVHGRAGSGSAGRAPRT